MASVISRARMFIDLKQISFDANLNVFHIIEDNGEVHMIKNKDKVYFCTCVQKTTCCQIVAVKIHNGKSVEELKSGYISAAVFEKKNFKKMGRKMKGHRNNSQATKTWKVVEDLFEKKRNFFVCNIFRENCDTNNKHVMCMKCYFYYHLKC